MRIAIGIEYDGTGYNGWQRQKSGTGVQEILEDALGRVADHPLEVVCAGRTDTGVHATGQVAHFDTTAERTTRSWLLGANSNLPDDVNLTWARPVPENFHARYSAVARTYRYLILNRLNRSSLYRRRAWWVHDHLDVARMQAAADLLLGERDFSAFRAAGCQARTATRELRRLDVRRNGDWLALTVTANAFLQHMVRNLAGTLVAVGSGEREPDWARFVLESGDRTLAGVAAPAHGLTLVRVDYPGELGLPSPDVPDLLPGMPA
ncbi:MAG: tRNA pseudouridine(38-40) synthase TruA [Gammaproteobacteria bacterium]|nr:tRNA pseudouridine(38-40) synthase TruA [Gammaproteobacteria bacterium]